MPLIVVLHGWGDTGSTFQFVVDALSRDWFVVAPDWRGFGRSRYRAHAYWFPDYLADLDRLLQHYSPAAPVRLVGHSMGGNVAALYAGVMPERVGALVNVEGFGLPDRDPQDAAANYRRWIEAGRREAPYREYASFEELADRIRRRSPRTRPELARFVAREWATQDGDGVVRLRADPAHRLPNAVLYRRAEARACWGRIGAAVQLVRGAESGHAAGAEAWPEPGQRFPIVTIEDCGHMVHFEQPAALADAIEDFLAREPL